MPERLVKLTVAYDGTAYVGWQVQPNGPTVQQVLEDALERLTGERVRVRGASRTDSGVHALGQVCTFVTSCSVPTENLARAITTRLPADVAVVHAEDAPVNFDPRHGAKRKLYRYTMATGPIRPVLDRHFAWHLKGPVDVAAMQQAAAQLVGHHDFTSFGNQECADGGEGNWRTIDRSELLVRGDRLVYEVEGRSFLYNMVRNIVGLLVDIGQGRRRADEVPAVFAARSRAAAGMGAPALGLCLVRIEYGD